MRKGDIVATAKSTARDRDLAEADPLIILT